MILLTVTFYALFCTRFAEGFNILNSNHMELKPMFADTGELARGNLELRRFSDCKSICEASVVKYDILLRTINNYMRRYVNLFLITSGMIGQSVKDSSEMITVDFKITISQEDLAYLKDFSKMTDETSVLNDFSRLEAIISRFIRQERSYLERSLRFLVSLLGHLCQIIFRLLVADYNYTIFLTICLVTYLMYRFSSRKSFYVYLSVIINSFIFWDGLTLYRKKLKETELEISWKLLRKPDDCDPANARWYHSVWSFFTGDKCFEFMRNANRNVYEEVSLFECLVERYSYYAIQTPARFLGVSLRDFTGQLLDLFPWTLRGIFTIPLLFIVLVIVAFSILILAGKRLKLSFFGASVEIEDSTENRKIKNTGQRRALTYRTLRLLPKSRLFKRVEPDSAKGNKSSLTSSKSESPLKHETSGETDAAQPSTANKSEVEKKHD